MSLQPHNSGTQTVQTRPSLETPEAGITVNTFSIVGRQPEGSARQGQGQVSQWIALSSQQAFKRRTDAAEAQAVPEWCPGAIRT